MLLSHGTETYPALLNALSDPRIHVRRYAAFCLGEMHRNAAIPELERALRLEIGSAAGEPYRGKEEPAVAAIVRALNKLDKRQLVDWLLRTSFSAAEQEVVRRQLVWLLPYGPPCKELPIAACIDQWRTYWREHRHESNRLFAE